MSYWNASSFSHWAYRKGIRITIIPDNQNKAGRNSLVVQCLGCCALTSEDWCSVTDWGIKIPQTEAQPKKKKGEKVDNVFLHRLFGKLLCSHFIIKIIVTVSLLGFKSFFLM